MKFRRAGKQESTECSLYKSDTEQGRKKRMFILNAGQFYYKTVCLRVCLEETKRLRARVRA